LLVLADLLLLSKLVAAFDDLSQLYRLFFSHLPVFLLLFGLLFFFLLLAFQCFSLLFLRELLPSKDQHFSFLFCLLFLSFGLFGCFLLF